MVRQIMCIDCGLRVYDPEPNDLGPTWNQRRVKGTVRRPVSREVLRCDRCNLELPDGTMVIAITSWLNEPRPLEWELEYIMPVH
jgi:hypothetical protein